MLFSGTLASRVSAAHAIRTHNAFYCNAGFQDRCLTVRLMRHIFNYHSIQCFGFKITILIHLLVAVCIPVINIIFSVVWSQHQFHLISTTSNVLIIMSNFNIISFLNCYTCTLINFHKTMPLTTSLIMVLFQRNY